MKANLRLAALAASVFLSLPSMSAADVPDQASDCFPSDHTSIGFMLPAGQSFRPQQDILIAAEFHLAVLNGTDANVTINVREGTLDGTILGTTARNLHIDMGAGDWFRFEFDPPIVVVPEATYVLEIVSDYSFGLGDADCGYTRGEAFESSDLAFINPVDFSFRTYGPCGNGELDIGEDCDDGVLAEDGCCATDCQFLDLGTPCAPDEDLCTEEACDGAGICASFAAPVLTCSEAEKASLGMTNSAKPDKDKIKFKWKNGVVTPESLVPLVENTSSLALCVYDGNTLIAGSNLPASVEWTVKPGDDSEQLDYKDKNGMIGGITATTIKRKGSGPDSSVSFQAGGENLTGFNMTSSLTGPVTAQVLTGSGACWGAQFSSDQIKKNDGEKFKAAAK